MTRVYTHVYPGLVAGLSGLLAIVLAATLVGPSHANGARYALKIVNSTGVPPTSVFVSLTPGTASPTLPNGMNFDQAYPLEGSQATPTYWQSLGGNAYQVELSGQWTSGTIMYSLGVPGEDFSGYDTQPTVGTNEYPFDLSELTFDGTNTFNGDISAVNQVGIPARLTVLKPDGTVANLNGTTDPATEYVGCVNTTRDVMQAAAPHWNINDGVWRTRNDSFVQIAGPGSASLYSKYPSFQPYIESLAGQTITIKGHFAGGPTAGAAAYYTYSGEFDDEGNLFLKGTLRDTAEDTGTTGYPVQHGIYIAGTELWGNDSSTWLAGTGFGIYAQNGPYLVGSAADSDAYLEHDSGTGKTLWKGPSTVPPASAGAYINSVSPGWEAGDPGAYSSVGNDVYGWIYGDLVVSFAMGYWGSDSTGTALYDSQRWNTNQPPGPNPQQPPLSNWWTPGGLPAYGAAWSSPPQFDRFNVYQYGTQSTGTSYGMSLGDRFSPDGTQNPELGVTNIPEGDFYGTWQVELLANHGCADATGLTPTSGPAAGGQEITISGRNIYPGATVTVGGKPATNVRVTLDPVTGVSTIKAVTPSSGSGTVPVVVTNSYSALPHGGDASTVPTSYRYIGAPPTPQPVCTATVVGVRKKKKFPVRKKVRLVKKVRTQAGCAVTVRTRVKPKKAAKVRVPSTNGPVRVRAQRKGTVVVRAVIDGRVVWSRTWRATR